IPASLYVPRRLNLPAEPVSALIHTSISALTQVFIPVLSYTSVSAPRCTSVTASR
ncbi:hypothetical protein K523DRAFT_326118, partial [Schizophyllum commune Tattone D]